MRKRALFLSLVAVCAAFGNAASPISLPDATSAPAAETILHVTVTDHRGNYITGFSREMFTVASGKEHLEIVSFSQNEPAEVLILIDRSDAMSDFYRRSGGNESVFYEMVSVFLENANPTSSVSVYAFNNAAEPLIAGTNDKKALLSAIKKLDALKSDGPKTIYDDCFLAVEKLSHSSRKKRVLLVFTKPSIDRGSKTKAKQLRDAASMNNILAFTVAVADRTNRADQLNQSYATREQMAAFDTLADLTASTGGRSFFPLSQQETALIFLRLGEELRHQYSLGVKFSDAAAANKWHSIKVKIDPPKGIPKFAIRNQEELFLK